MSKSSSLKARLNYRGGVGIQDRMIRDKDRSLRSAIKSSYQAATAILPDQKEFRCLINPNKFTEDMDEKILSITFYSIPVSVRPPVPCEPVIGGVGSEGYWEDMVDIITPVV